MQPINDDGYYYNKDTTITKAEYIYCVHIEACILSKWHCAEIYCCRNM
jgi:hypothetical protein